MKNYIKVYFLLFLVWSCNTNDEHLSSTHQNNHSTSSPEVNESMSTSVSNPFDQYSIGLYDSNNNFLRIDKNSMTLYLEDLFSLGSGDITSFFIESIQYSNGIIKKYIVGITSDGKTSISTPLTFDIWNGNEVLLITNTTCSCTSTDCAYIPGCNPKFNEEDECYCTKCVATCTKSSTATSPDKLISFFIDMLLK